MQGSKKLLLAAALGMVGTTALWQATPAEARTHVTIYATTAPPPLRHEIVPAPRRGYVWVPGAWEWSHRHYAWHKGHWVRARHGYHYVPPRWEHEGKRWRHYDGHWDH